MKFWPQRTWRQLHWWMSILLSLQLLAWFSSGFFMAVIPIETIRGDHLKMPWPQPDWSRATLPLAQLSHQGSLQAVKLTQRQQIPVYYFQDALGEHWLDATNGEPLAELPLEQIPSLLQSQVSQPLTDLQLLRLNELPAEAQGLSPPIVRGTTADQTHWYIHGVTGQLLRVRTALWRSYDFFWMLHIMDYETRENFNNPLLITTSLSALLFTCTGLVLMLFRWRRGRR